MEKIEVDFQVYKALFVRRETEATTFNDVLRDLLELPPAGPEEALPASVASHSGGWFAKGVLFPAGTEFRASYKGAPHFGEVKNEALWIDGKPFNSLSAAAVAITNSPVNGWRFWEVRLPGKIAWQLAESLRP